MGSVAVFILAGYFFAQHHATLLAVVSFLIILWTNEGLPMGVVSLLPLLLFPSFGVLEFNLVTVNYAKPVIFLFLGGFMIAIAIKETGLHKVIAYRLLGVFPNSARGVIYSLAITAALLSSILSNTTITLMLLPIALYLTENVQLKVRFLLATAYGASIGGVLTPIGTPPNLILMGYMEAMEIVPPTFLEWVGKLFPIAAIMLLLVPFILSWGVKNTCIQWSSDHKPEELTIKQKRLTYILYGLVILLVLNSPIKPFYTGLGLNEKMILLGFGLLMFVPKVGFLEWSNISKIPLEIVFLFGAGFSIATAFMHSGITNTITGYLLELQNLSYFALLISVALFVSFTTEITSNTALISIVIPIFHTFSQQIGLNEQVILMAATIAASYAFMLPIATPPNAIVMSSRVIKIKEMAKVGFAINLLGVLVLSLTAYFYW